MNKLRLLAAAAMAAGVVLLAAPMASATPSPHPVISACHQGWYVNPDEEALLPDQVPAGFLFDGPSLVHHSTPAVSIAVAPTDAAFAASGPVVGVLPLFKVETLNPYSTINKTPDGYWSSKITSGPGSMSAPVASIAAFVGLATTSPDVPDYTITTTLLSFGVGYANDAGNKATVSSITFGGTTHNLACVPAPSSSSASAAPSSTPPSSAPPSSATPSTPASSTPPASVPPSASASATLTPPVPGSGGSGTRLPLTGVASALVAGTGLALIAAGLGLWMFTRRRRTEFVAE